MSCASLVMSAAKASPQALSLTLAERVMRQFKLGDADFNFPANGTGPGTDMSDWLMAPVSTAAEHNFCASMMALPLCWKDLRATLAEPDRRKLLARTARCENYFVSIFDK